jgi:hypothetical protein
MLNMFFMLFLVSNFCCKSFATSNEETIDKVVNWLKSNQNSHELTVLDNEYYSNEESSVAELFGKLAKKPTIKHLTVNLTLNPDSIIKLFVGIATLPALEGLEITNYRHFEISVTTEQVLQRMDDLLKEAAENFLAEESSCESHFSRSSDGSANQVRKNFNALSQNCNSYSSSRSSSDYQQQSRVPFADSLKSSICEGNSESESDIDCNCYSLIKYLAKEEVKMVGEDYAKSFMELSKTQTVKEFDEYIHNFSTDILTNDEDFKTRQQLMTIFFNLKENMEKECHSYFHENGRGYIPSCLAELIQRGFFQNLKQLILPYPKNLSGAPFDEKEAIVWMKKILPPSVSAIFAA